MKDKIIMARVNTLDEYADGAVIAFIPGNVIADAEVYQGILEGLKKDGLSPHSITQFDYRCTFLDTCPDISPEFAKNIVCPKHDAEYLAELVKEAAECGVITVNDMSEVEDFENKQDLRIDCSQLHVDSSDFHYDCYMKHCGVMMETAGIVVKDLTPLTETEEYKESNHA